MDYDFGELDFGDDSEPARARRTGWLQAVQYGFHEGRLSEEYEKLWLEHVEADGVVCRGAWLPADAFGAGPVPVATTSWFDKTLNVGREMLPLRMITDVTTSAAHRRRGLVRRLMEDCLADAAEAGLPLAALTVSEATIYGRWGFGAATFAQEATLDTGPRFGLRDHTDPGRVEFFDPRDSWPMIRDHLDRLHATSRGSVGLPAFYEPFLTGAWNFREAGPDKQLRGVVHLDADEHVDGLVLYRQDGRDEQNWRKVKVVAMLADHPTTRLSLWEFLGGIDLVRTVTWGLMPADDPLRWALRDLNALKLGSNEEFLWVRVLDVPVALGARPWAADGEVVIEVTDAQGHAAGRWLVATAGGIAKVVPTDQPAELALDAETLGTFLLGPVPVTTLHHAGRITGDETAAARLGAMADLAEPPYNLLGF
ncbi:GNAT family N-acetyltransferase [Nocardioides euryhalodurans]|uniref:GNAT family N-acetyltransferase n=1 Tax=Nocardioides euryhalodurans TaxID=2518370 RepID=UPI0014212BED|nr:GNAT family N-acetyltransferase [Nocardioides euryhalodurans]